MPSLLGGGDMNGKNLPKPMGAVVGAPNSHEPIELATGFGGNISAASSVGSTPRRACSSEEQGHHHQLAMSSLKQSIRDAAKKIAGEAGAKATGMLSMLKASKKGTAPHHPAWEVEHREHGFAQRAQRGVTSPAPSGSGAGSSSHHHQVQQQDSGDFNSRIQAAFQALERPSGGMHV